MNDTENNNNDDDDDDSIREGKVKRHQEKWRKIMSKGKARKKTNPIKVWNEKEKQELGVRFAYLRPESGSKDTINGHCEMNRREEEWSSNG